jgi:hypothetical protein
MASSEQRPLPFQQISGKDLQQPINVGPDGSSVSLDEMAAMQQHQKQMQQMYAQQQAAHQAQAQQAQAMARAQALENRMKGIAKEELRLQALGFVSIGVVLIVVAFMATRKGGFML